MELPFPVNPALTGLPEYFTDTTAQARREQPDADWIDLSIGDPDEPAPDSVRRALIDAVEPVLRYPTAAGRPELREAVAGWVLRRHGVEVDPDTQVLPSSGSKEAVFHLPLALIDRAGARRGVVWASPGYPIYERGAVLAGGVSEPMVLDAAHGWRLELEALDDAVLSSAALAWVNYPHNPTGATVDAAYLRRQRDVAAGHGIVLASDECYQELWFDHPAPSVLEVCDGDLSGVLAFVSLSKRSGMTGYRSGAIVGDARLIALLRRLRVNIGTASPGFVQAAAIAAWSDQGHVEQRRAVFDGKREVLLGFLEDAGIEVSGSTGAFYVWFRAPGGDDVAYAHALLGEQVLVTPGRSFGPGGEGWIRAALVPSVERIEVAIRRWRAAIDAGRL